MRKIPSRWQTYKPVGRRVRGTKFLPFKVPLQRALMRGTPQEEWFTPTILMEMKPNLRAVIDLTNTTRYYNPREFLRQGVLYRKIQLPGHGVLPTRYQINKFFQTVDDLLDKLQHESDALIGVHCTHGLNRTGYFICKYMVSRMNVTPSNAIRKFQNARGHHIERMEYVEDIKNCYE